MLKKAISFVLDLPTSSTYPRGYVSGVDFVCGLAADLFEHLLIHASVDPISKVSLKR
jgi:hypothetical protein